MDLNRLTCIDLDLPTLEGFRRFVSAWLYRGDDVTFLVDPGPLATVPHLLAELRRHGVARLDYLLLTHIHIDHAGGAGAVLEAYPEAQAICHPEGISHLVAPEKLWQGTRKVLGAMAEAYGEIVPVPEGRISFRETIGTSGVRAYLTPGHAQHHLCFLLDDLLFGGEVAGVRTAVPEGIYLRPATPPRFLLPVALASLDRMIALRPRYLVFAHYGLVEPALDYLRIGRRQLLLWVRGVIATREVEDSRREEACFEWLRERDEIFRNIRQLPPELFARERVFLGNTLRGMSEYVAGLSSEERRALADA